MTPHTADLLAATPTTTFSIYSDRASDRPLTLFDLQTALSQLNIEPHDRVTFLQGLVASTEWKLRVLQRKLDKLNRFELDADSSSDEQDPDVDQEDMENECGSSEQADDVNSNEEARTAGLEVLSAELEVMQEALEQERAHPVTGVEQRRRGLEGYE